LIFEVRGLPADPAQDKRFAGAGIVKLFQVSQFDHGFK